MIPVKSFSDEELIKLLQEGNHSAYTEIYSRYSGVLYVHAYNKLRNREEAKDILQELFTKLWVNRENLPLETYLAGYLYQAIQNRVLKLYAYKKVRMLYVNQVQQIEETGSSITDHLVRTQQLTEMIEREISNLPDKMKQVFILSRRNYMSHKMIAEHLGIAETTVKAHIHHALKILRTKLTLMAFLLLLIR